MKKSELFPVSSFFDIKKGKRLTKADMIPGDIPFVGSSASNNGITAYIGNDTHLHDAGTISVSYNGSVGEVFLQDERFWASDDVNVWYPKKEMPVGVKLYFMAAIKKLAAKYSYADKWTIDKMRAEEVELPVDVDGKPDYGYMREHIARLERERIAALDAYLASSGLDDYELTDEDKKILSLSSKPAPDETSDPEARLGDGEIAYKPFPITDVFDVKNTKCFMKSQVGKGSGETPYLTASSANNGIGAYISCGEDWLDKGDCIFIGGKTMVVSYQERDFVSNDSHNLALYLKDESKRTRRTQLFLCAAISRALSQKYYWGDSVSWRKIQTDKIMLPTTSEGAIDFDYMERYIRAIEKVVIADVARYRDKVLGAAEQAVKP